MTKLQFRHYNPCSRLAVENVIHLSSSAGRTNRSGRVKLDRRPPSPPHLHGTQVFAALTPLMTTSTARFFLPLLKWKDMASLSFTYGSWSGFEAIPRVCANLARDYAQIHLTCTIFPSLNASPPHSLPLRACIVVVVKSFQTVGHTPSAPLWASYSDEEDCCVDGAQARQE